MRLVYRFAPPRAHPVANTRVGAEYDLSDWRVGECTQPQGRYGDAKADLRHSLGKVLRRKICVSPNEFGARIPLTRFLEGGPSNVNGVEISEHAFNWLATPKYGGRRKQRCVKVGRKFRPRDLDYLFDTVSLHDERQGRRTFVPTSALHPKDIANIWPQKAHRISLKSMSNLCARITSCFQKRPRSIETIGNCVFCAKWRVVYSTVDAFADFAGIQRNGKVHVKAPC